MIRLRRALCLVLVSLSTTSAAQVLAIETVPAGADVSVDGRVVGQSPIVIATAPGAHQVGAALPRYVPVESPVYAAPDDTTRVTLRLTPADGAIRVVGLPDDATIDTPGWAMTGEVSRVGPGISTIRVRLPGQPDLTARVPVEPGAETTVEIVEEFSTRGFSGNLVFPGSSQISRGRPLAGIAYAIGTSAAVATAIGAHLRVRTADDDLEAATEVYDEARSETEVVAAYELIDAAYDRGQASRRLRTGAAVTAGVVYLASLIDAAWRYGRQPAVRVGVPALMPSWSVRPTDRGLTARLSF